jgi:perosamine synthetase
MEIPFYKPYITENETNAVLRVLKSGKLSKGKEVEEFEKEFANYIGKKYAIAVNSGTSGLHLVVRTLGWKRGDEIIATPFSFIASSNALLFEGITPIFVDINKNTLNIDPDKIEEKITPNTKGMLLVHILGLPANYEKIKKIVDKYNLPVIEDACEAIGKPSENFIVSKLGVASVYGFHENKQLTTGGEGGMIVTDDPVVAQKCRSMRDQGRSLDKEWIKNVILGYNFRMTEIQAALGREQLKIIDKMLAKREEIANKYSILLSGVKGLTTPSESISEKRSWFIYFVILESSDMREKIYQALSNNRIASSTNYFPPIYNFPMYAGCNKECAITDDISGRILALPMFYEMTDEQINQVVDVIKKAIK